MPWGAETGSPERNRASLDVNLVSLRSATDAPKGAFCINSCIEKLESIEVLQDGHD
jgi:hypothetical protein